MEMITNDDIIPVTFKSGSGGNFLCHFLISAKINNKELVKIGTTGNVHLFGFNDVTKKAGLQWVGKDDQFIINTFAGSMKPGAVAPYFLPVHLYNLNLISESFKKSIRIVYDLDDAKDIATVFFNKFYNTPEARNVKSSLGLKTLEEEIYNTATCQPMFKYEPNITNVLFVSWKEFFRGDAESLITKLSVFTDIDASNFSRESLSLWRSATEQALNK